MTEANPLTEKALVRLRAIAEGNGLDPAKIELIGADEKDLTLKAEMHLSLTLASEKSRTTGHPHAPKNATEIQTLPSVADIPVRAEEFRQSLIEKAGWITEAVEELKTAPGQGFGLERADITLDALARLFRANENCPSCGGKGNTLCESCRGVGTTACHQCIGTGQENCPTCMGRGHDPADPQRYCHMCNGATRVPCRLCYGRRTLTCPSCNGRANITCNACGGQGVFTIEERALPVVRCDFRVLDSADLPSGVRRMLDKGGLKALARGQGRITQEAPLVGENKTAFIPYTAVFPFAEVRLRINGRAIKASVIGQKAVLRDVPPFLDPVFDAAMVPIAKNPGHAKALENAFKLRAMRDLFAVMQEGGEVEKNFRRLYPVGFSQAMIARMQDLLRKISEERTFMSRAAAAGFSLLVLGAIFYGIAAGGVRASIAAASFPAAAYLFDIFVGAASFGFVNLALRFAAATHLRSLTRQNEKVSFRAQRAGSLGLSVGICAILFYGAMLWFLKATPFFLD